MNLEELKIKLESIKNPDKIIHQFDDENINTYANLIYSANNEKGFWPERRDIKQVILLSLSEISEALDEHRAGKDPFYYLNGKPEGWAIEIADAVIRVLDCIGGIDRIDFEIDDKFMEALMTGSEILVRSYAVQGKQYQSIFSDDKVNLVLNLKSFVYYMEEALRELDHNLIELIDIKLKYNITRPHKHGKSY